MKISIITVNYNDASGLERTIRSVRALSFKDKEFIIIDGASKDGSVDIILRNKDIITKWVSEPDSGIYNAMNKGIRMATGDYCIFMNSGDAFYNGKVLQEVQKFLRTGKDIYNGNAFYISDGKIAWYRKCHKDNSELYFYQSSICHQATFIKTSLMKSLMYDENLRMVSDWKFWVEAISRNHASYEAINVDICCFDWGGVTTTQHDRGVMERNKVLEELYTKDERIMFDSLSEEKKIFNYLLEGFSKHFWLCYARLFKTKQVAIVYGK